MAKTRSISPLSKPETGGSRREPTSFAGRRLALGGHLLTAAWIALATVLTGLNTRWADNVEHKLQTFFFEVRGVVPPPEDIVILAIDEAAFSRKNLYQTDPDRYAFLAPIQTWPWRRESYARVLEKLMGAGARAVAFDLVFDTPSGYGEADDQYFADAIARYRDRVVLASQYAFQPTDEGLEEYLISPIDRFRPASGGTGLINYPLSPNGQIHQLGHHFIQQHRQALSGERAALFDFVMDGMPTFAEATLQAAGQEPGRVRKGSHIFFYGPGSVFPHVSLVDVLDPDAWEHRLQSGAYFKDKIVLVGATADALQDFHGAPFSQSWLYPQKMAGVEIHAQSIATLLENRAIAEALPDPWNQGLLVLGVTGLAGWLLSRPRQPLWRWVWAVGMAIAWGGTGYILFVYGRLIVPTAVPTGAIALCGFSQLVMGTAREQQKKKQLRDTLRQYATSPIVQEIISQQDDLHDLLRERELALSGKRLANRYRIIRVLGAGGFSETYIAEDIQRPGKPLCVVKQLRVISDNPNAIKMARRLFATEAETLEHLGQHEQIPQLLACFEENEEFYLVQEFIPGRPLSHELLPQRSLSEDKVISLLQDILGILDFVHGYGVIHRDLKPSNIIRRKRDGKLVLIDFGIAKKITTQLADLDHQGKFTVAVGTPGYMPSEQSAGRPHFSSDIYALGMIAIEALTGISPQTLKYDPKTGEVLWHAFAPSVSPELQQILDGMVRQDVAHRYSSVNQVRQAIARSVARLAPGGTTVAEDDGSIAFESDVYGVPSDGTNGDLLEDEDDLATVSLPEDWSDAQEPDDLKTVPLPKNWILDYNLDEPLNTVPLPEDWGDRLGDPDPFKTVPLPEDWGDRQVDPDPFKTVPLPEDWGDRQDDDG